MSGIMGILDIAGRALRAEQLGVEVTGHNIANVNTPGYSRQQVDFQTSLPLASPWGHLGDGVDIKGIRRFFDPYLALKLDEKTASYQFYETQKTDLEKLAALFNETQEGGLNQILDNFWAAWYDLANNPSGSAERQVVVQRAQVLSDAFQTRAEELVQARMSLGSRFAAAIDQINAHTAKIAELNRQIVSAEAGGRAANDLRDQRQVELTKLSEYLGIRYYESPDGNLNVTLQGGHALVQGVEARELSYAVDAQDNIVIIWHGSGGQQQDITATLRGGQLSAWIQMRDQVIPGYQESFDRLAKELIGAVNRQHSLGVGRRLFSAVTGTYAVDDPDQALKNNPNLPFGDRIDDTAGFTIHVEDGGTPAATATITLTAGMTLNQLRDAINTHPQLSSYVQAQVTSDHKLSIQVVDQVYTFGFSNDNANLLMALGINTFFSGDQAYTFALNDTVGQDAELIAAGQFDSQGQHPVGDNRNALALAELQSAAAGPDGLTFAEAYQKLVSDIGLDTHEAQQQSAFYQEMAEHFSTLRDSLSGVSLDEELTNLMKYQRAYQAAARLISATDELFQTLLEMK